MESNKQERFFSKIIELRSGSNGPVTGTAEPGAGFSDLDPVDDAESLSSPDQAVGGDPTGEAGDFGPAIAGCPSPEQCLRELERDFIWIPPGRFVMGSPAHEPGRGENERAHPVELGQGFYLQRTPVTRGLWLAVMGSNPANFTGDAWNCPVEGVSWEDCLAFIGKLDEVTGRRHQLPTEAQWEYACRAGTRDALAGGPLHRCYCDLDPVLDELGWYCGNSERRPHPVGTKAANPWGLLDMHGNIWEWCADWHGPFDGSSQRDPTGPPAGSKKVVRGGSWFSAARNCRSAARLAWDPRAASDTIGFRLLRPANEPA